MRMTALTTSTHTHPHSENLAEIVDEEVREMVKKAYATTRALLQDKYEGLKQVRQPLSLSHTHSLSPPLLLLAAEFHRIIAHSLVQSHL
jgi:ATP-dependent Zn protease